MRKLRSANRIAKAIPIASYLKKWVVKDFLHGQEVPYKIDRDTLLWQQVICVMSNYVKEKSIKKSIGKIKLNDALPIVWSSRFLRSFPTEGKLININLYLDKLFKYSLSMFLLAHDKKNKKDAIIVFLERYQITPDEVNIESLYRRCRAL